jgi:hypothetical protein
MGTASRNAICEWTSIIAGSLAIGFFIYWGVSVASHAADLKLKVSTTSRVPNLLVTEGRVFICGEQPNDLNNPYADGWTPLSFAGVMLRYRLLDGVIAWTVGVSLLIPAAFLAVLSGYCVWRCRSVFAGRDPNCRAKAN